MRQVGAALWPKLRVLQIYGANTGVGKTIFSSILCRAFLRHVPTGGVRYLKPISTGPLEEADDRYDCSSLLRSTIDTGIGIVGLRVELR